MTYQCHQQMEDQHKSWSGTLKLINQTDSQYEIQISGRGSAYWVIVGTYRYGNYLCIPTVSKGCELAALSDVFWNKEQLSGIMNEPDAITIAYGLKALSLTI